MLVLHSYCMMLYDIVYPRSNELNLLIRVFIFFVYFPLHLLFVVFIYLCMKLFG